MSNCLNYEDLRGKRVLVRVDFNVPIQNGVVMDDSRIKQVAPTIHFLKKSKAKIILMSHIGKTATNGNGQSLKVVVNDLYRIYNSNVIFVDDCLSSDASKIIEAASPDEIILLENLRFYEEEERCDTNFAKKIAFLADFYINDAFPVAHRKHASVCEVPKLLPHAFGISFLREIEAIDNFLHCAKSPKMCIVGGSKLSTKINLLKNLTKKVDKLALGGKIAIAFLEAAGNSSVSVEEYAGFKEDIAEILDNSEKYGCELILPVDFTTLSERIEPENILNAEVRESIVDIGPKSIDLFKKHIRESASVLWNGPVGLFEHSPFDFGTSSIAKEIAELTRAKRITSIVGGGDTVFALKKCGVTDSITYVSTSGGAFLTYLEGRELPALQCAHDAYKLNPSV